MLIQLVAFVFGFIGWFTGIKFLFLLGGIVALFLDIINFIRGELNLLFPLILYAIGVMIGNSLIEGILLGAIISVGFESVFGLLLIVGISVFGFFKK